MKLHKYTKEQLINSIKESVSIREALARLNIAPAGGNYQTIKKAIEHFKIDTSHFKGQGYLKGKTHGWKTRNLKDILINKKQENTSRLKLRLLNEKVKKPICECCGLKTWQECPIPLELHHIDGNTKNNTLSNLELLCPNCHAQTDNYRGKGIKK
jgi:hypothetical protein